jgi:hypothetical protein
MLCNAMVCYGMLCHIIVCCIILHYSTECCVSDVMVYVESDIS